MHGVKTERQRRYADTIQDLKSEGFYTEPITVTRLNTNLVTTSSVQKGITGRALDIRCPAGRVMTICGFENSGVDPGDFAKAPHLYSIPHQFSIRCFSKDNVELSPYTAIRITKELPSMEIYRIDEVLYGDLSLTFLERFKRKEERYYFLNTVILFGEQCLRLLPVDPDIDIARTELFMKCDLSTMRE